MNATTYNVILTTACSCISCFFMKGETEYDIGSNKEDRID